MTEPKLRLNLGAKSGDTKDTAAKVREAGAKKKAATETLDEAWARILAMKNNSAADQAKLLEVRDAMQSGLVGRDSEGKRFSKAEALRMYKVLAEQQREQKLVDLVESTPENYRLIVTERQFERLVDELKGEDIVAIDTETTGVDVYVDVIVGISITLPKRDYHVYIPVDHCDVKEQLDRQYVLDGLRPMLGNKSVGKVLHNAIFDINMFRRHDVKLTGVVWDTMTAMHLLNENEGDKNPDKPYALKNLAPKYLGVESDTFAELFTKDAKFSEVPLDVALVYAAKDTHLTWDLYKFQQKHMRKMPTIFKYYNEVEAPLLEVIADLEANGYVLDLDFAKKYGEKLRKEADDLYSYLIAELEPYHEGDGPLNINSTPQMKPVLSKAIGKEIPNLDANKTLKPMRKDYEIIDRLLEYKRITKLSGTYIDTLPTKQNAGTKRWHSRFNPMGTVTGRFSSGKDKDDQSKQGFNAQNQPAEARPMFVAPPGKVLVGADFKAQEIRCVAYMSGEEVLINAFLENRDPYAMMASNFYKRPYEEVYKNADGSDTKERKQMKVVWLATLYGMSKYSLAEMLGTDVNAAVKFQTELFESMPQLNAWIEGNRKFVEKNGFVWTDKQARKRRLPDAKLKLKGWGDPNFGKKNRAMRQATNARVQGSSSVQTKVTMLRAHEYCVSKTGWSLWSSVHDELIFEVPEDFTKEEADDIRRIMVDSYRWGDVLPNGTDIEVMRRWGEGVPLDEWFKQKEENEC